MKPGHHCSGGHWQASLKDYFAGVAEPPNDVPAAVVKWLEDLLRFVMSNKASAAIDFGGGDSSLGQLNATSRI